MVEARNFLFLFYGLAAVWVIVAGYVFYLSRRESRLEKSLESLRNLVRDSQTRR